MIEVDTEQELKEFILSDPYNESKYITLEKSNGALLKSDFSAEPKFLGEMWQTYWSNDCIHQEIIHEVKINYNPDFEKCIWEVV
jgi:hypothetical protein